MSEWIEELIAKGLGSWGKEKAGIKVGLKKNQKQEHKIDGLICWGLKQAGVRVAGMMVSRIVISPEQMAA